MELGGRGGGVEEAEQFFGAVGGVAVEQARVFEDFAGAAGVVREDDAAGGAELGDGDAEVFVLHRVQAVAAAAGEPHEVFARGVFVPFDPVEAGGGGFDGAAGLGGGVPEAGQGEGEARAGAAGGGDELDGEGQPFGGVPAAEHDDAVFALGPGQAGVEGRHGRMHDLGGAAAGGGVGEAGPVGVGEFAVGGGRRGAGDAGGERGALQGGEGEPAPAGPAGRGDGEVEDFGVVDVEEAGDGQPGLVVSADPEGGRVCAVKGEQAALIEGEAQQAGFFAEEAGGGRGAKVAGRAGGEAGGEARIHERPVGAMLREEDDVVRLAKGLHHPGGDEFGAGESTEAGVVNRDQGAA